jgi:hypothetical protein
MTIELIRQFYDMPRHFRVLGQYGAERFVTYTNQDLQLQQQMGIGHTGMRLPVFDVKISAQRKSVYTKVSQNELALQFFNLGFFDPARAETALMCLGMMDFDGRDELMQQVYRNGTMMQKLAMYMQLALQLAPAPQKQQIYNDMVNTLGAQMPQMVGAPTDIEQRDNVTGGGEKEHAFVEKARAQSQTASQPDGGKVVADH